MNRDAFESVFLKILPDRFVSSARLMYDDDYTEEETGVVTLIESFRNKVGAISGELHSYGSPHSGTFQKTEDGHVEAGPYTASSAKGHARTGVEKKGGVLLRRIAIGLDCRHILELGTNIGLSGGYFLSCPQLERLVTIEGSKDLSEIADHNLSQVTNKYKIMNMLFDDAIDQLREAGETFDCVFIDGQHEHEATMHYTKRVMPLLDDGGCIIFDDIYWSEGMNLFWKEACRMSEFATTVDLRLKGIAILQTGAEEKTHFDICEYLGRPRFYNKGW